MSPFKLFNSLLKKPPGKRLVYAIVMWMATSVVLVPLDLAVLNWGLFDFFVSPWSFLLLILFWFMAPWVSEKMPYFLDDSDDDY